MSEQKKIFLKNCNIKQYNTVQVPAKGHHILFLFRIQVLRTILVPKLPVKAPEVSGRFNFAPIAAGIRRYHLYTYRYIFKRSYIFIHIIQVYVIRRTPYPIRTYKNNYFKIEHRNAAEHVGTSFSDIATIYIYIYNTF